MPSHCLYRQHLCILPRRPDSDFEYSTQSYTGCEPTSMRAIRARYDPFEQARGRVDQLKSLGHSVDKVEYIIMGGTFMSLAESYRENFIAQLHNALSGYQTSKVDEAVEAGELSNVKCVGITIETRPDYCLQPHLTDMLEVWLHETGNRCPSPCTKMWLETRIAAIPSRRLRRRFAWPRTLDSRWLAT